MISFNEFKQFKLCIGIIEKISNNKATINCGSIKSENDLPKQSNSAINDKIAMLLNENSAIPLYVKTIEGKYSILTVEGNVAAGTLIE